MAYYFVFKGLIHVFFCDNIIILQKFTSGILLASQSIFILPYPINMIIIPNILSMQIEAFIC